MGRQQTFPLNLDRFQGAGICFTGAQNEPGIALPCDQVKDAVRITYKARPLASEWAGLEASS